MNGKFEIIDNQIYYLGQPLKSSDLTGDFLLRPLNPQSCLDCTQEIFEHCSKNEILPDTPQCRTTLYENQAGIELRN